MPLDPAAIAQIPLPVGKINLNAGTLSPVPKPVQHRAAELREQMASNPSDFCWRQTPPLIQASRKALAGFLNVSPDELLLLPNVTWAVNLVISSLTLLRGTEVLTTDHDYGACSMTLQRWGGVRDWSMRTLELPFPDPSRQQILDAFEAALTPSTRVLFVYHISSPSGYVLPLKEICALARSREIITLVDGAHAPGSIPLDLADIGADFYAANTHKWLMGPPTSGFLHVARQRRLDIRPLITSWGWGYNRSAAFEDSGNGGSRWQWDLEFHGTIDRVPQMVVPEMLAFRRALTGPEGDAALYAHRHDLQDYARTVIPLPCRSATDPSLQGPILVFEVPRCDSLAVRDRLYHDFNIESPITHIGGQNSEGRQFLRLSTAPFTKRSDIDALAAAVRQIFPV